MEFYSLEDSLPIKNKFYQLKEIKVYAEVGESDFFEKLVALSHYEHL